MSMQLPALATLERLQALLDELQPLVQTGGGEQTDEGLEPEALWEAAQAALQAADHVRAVSLWSRLAQTFAGEPACHFGLGLALQGAGAIEQAGRQFSHAFALDPTDAACAFRLGECLLALGWTSEAHDALLAAQQLCELAHNPPEIRDMALRLSEQLH